MGRSDERADLRFIFFNLRLELELRSVALTVVNVCPRSKINGLIKRTTRHRVSVEVSDLDLSADFRDLLIGRDGDVADTDDRTLMKESQPDAALIVDARDDRGAGGIELHLDLCRCRG